MADDTQDGYEPLKPPPGGFRSPRTPPPRRTPPDGPSAIAKPGPENGESTILLMGPSSTGKTLLLAALGQACSQRTLDELIIKYNQINLHDIIVARNNGHTARMGLAASAMNRTYDFSITVEKPSKNGKKPSRSLGSRHFTCIDGPGGALFFDELKAGERSEEFTKFAKELIDVGTKASSIVIMVNPKSESVDHLVMNQLPGLLGKMAHEVMASQDPEQAPPSLKDKILKLLRGLLPMKPAAETGVANGKKAKIFNISADRILLVLNFFDQICLEWMADYPDRFHEMSPFDIADHCAAPIWLANDVFGPDFLYQVMGYMKPDAELAVAVCTAGGFVRETGEPYLDEIGRPNCLYGVQPAEMLPHLVLFGLKEILLFAGYGIATPGMVEVVTPQSLLDNQVQE